MNTQASTESYLSLNCQFELHFEIPGKDGEKELLWTGKSDYSYWYGSPENVETNLIVIETKRKYAGTSGRTQLIEYMGKYQVPGHLQLQFLTGY